MNTTQIPSAVVAVPPGRGGWGVLTVHGPVGQPRFQTEPCPRCPWRRDAPTGAFPAEAFRHSALTTYDLAVSVFACHASAWHMPLTCAGFLLRGASDNLTVRMLAVDLSAVRSPVPLYDNYRQMAIANGVAPDDPALAPCRGDRPVEYLPDRCRRLYQSGTRGTHATPTRSEGVTVTKRLTAAEAADLYARTVLDALSPAFSDLGDPTTRETVVKALQRHATTPDPAFEVIIDDPVSANWRLRGDPARPGRVRLACYRRSPGPADLDLEDRLNGALADLDLT